MTHLDEKTYRIWLKRGSTESSFNQLQQARISTTLEGVLADTNQLQKISEGDRENAGTYYGKFEFGYRTYDFTDQNLPEDIELDLEECENGVFFLTFNNIPRICLIKDSLPVAAPSPEIFAIRCFSELSTAQIQGILSWPKLNTLHLETYSKESTLEAFKGALNLERLNLAHCERITNLEALEGLSNLKSLTLQSCRSLKKIDSLGRLAGLNELSVTNCEWLSDVGVLAPLKNLISLKISGCESLGKTDVFSSNSNLKDLSLSGCKSLSDVKALANLGNLETLELFGCESLRELHLSKEQFKLKSLKLSKCKSLIDVDGLEGLLNLEKMFLNGCESLTKISSLGELSSLNVLDLSYCKSLKNLRGLGNFRSLNKLNLTACESLEQLDFLNSLSELEELNLRGCKSITSLKPLSALVELRSLNLKDSNYLNRLDSLKHLTRLRELKFNNPVEVVRVLSQTGKKDQTFIKNKINEWLEVTGRATHPEDLATDLADTLSQYALEEWASDALSKLIEMMLPRETIKESIWRGLLDAVSACSESQSKLILGKITQHYEKQDSSSILRPLLRTLTSLPETLTDWANQEVDRLLSSHSTNFLRDYGPSICLFYARMKRESKVSEWLEKLTEPSVPRWRDRIFLALAKWEMERGDVETPRLRLKEMNQGSEKDELLELLALSLAREKPLEAGALLDQISEEWRQLSLSEELVKVPNFTEPAENAYRLLLHMEREPEKLADWVVVLLQNNPESELARQVAGSFLPHQSDDGLKSLIFQVLDAKEIKLNTKPKQLNNFQENLFGKQDWARCFLQEALLLKLKQDGLIDDHELKS